MDKTVWINGVRCNGADAQKSGPEGVRTVFPEEARLVSAAAGTLEGLDREQREEVAVFLGVDDVVDRWKEEFFRGVLKDGALGASPLLFPYTSPNALAARLTIAFGLKGAEITVASGPLSFLKALGYARGEVCSGRVKRALVGGVTPDAALTMLLGGEAGSEFVQEAVDTVAAPGTGRVVETMDETFSSFTGALSSAAGGGEGRISMADRSGRAVCISLGSVEPSSMNGRASEAI